MIELTLPNSVSEQYLLTFMCNIERCIVPWQQKGYIIISVQIFKI